MDHHTLFNDKAALYQSARPTYPPELFRYLASLCETHRLAWDCACGNGQAAMSLVKHFERVHASDVSHEQIRHATLHPNIRYQIAVAEKSGLDDNSCDIVSVAQALHWFDFKKFWPEVQRVLKPNGVFSAWGYNFPRIGKRINAQIQALIYDEIEPFWSPLNKLIWNGYRDIDFPFEKIETPTFKMSVQWNLDELFNAIHTFSATRRYMDENGDEFFQSAYRTIGNTWGDPAHKATVNFEFVLYVGRHLD